MLWVGEWGVGVVCVGLVVGPPTRDSVVVLWTNFLVFLFLDPKLTLAIRLTSAQKKKKIQSLFCGLTKQVKIDVFPVIDTIARNYRSVLLFNYCGSLEKRDMIDCFGR